MNFSSLSSPSNIKSPHIRLLNKTGRVKGIDFHPKLPWIIVTLFNGQIQIWNYVYNTLVDVYNGHTGPVRGVNFHHQSELFVTGSNDTTVKLWDYSKKKCIHTFTGHLDYVRSVYFHHEHPWIVSASDDQSVRVWNWQSRSRLAELLGHSSLVMCAKFHPSKDIIASCSLDTTVRIWNIAGLKDKHVSSAIHEFAINFLTLPISIITDCSIGSSHTTAVTNLDWSSNGDELVSISEGRITRIWKLQPKNGHYNPVTVKSFTGPTQKMHACAWKNNIIVTGGSDGKLRFYEANKKVYVDDIPLSSRIVSVVAHPTLDSLFAVATDNDFSIVSYRPTFETGAAVKDGRIFSVDRNKLLVSKVSDLKFDEIAEIPRALASEHAFGADYICLRCSGIQLNKGNDIYPAVITYFDGINYSSFLLFKAGVSSSKYVSESPMVAVRRGTYAYLSRGSVLINVISSDNKQLINAKSINSRGYRKLFSGPDGYIVLTKANTAVIIDVKTGEDIVTFSSSSEIIDLKFAENDVNFHIINSDGIELYTFEDGTVKFVTLVESVASIIGSCYSYFKRREVPSIIYTTNSALRYILPNGDVGTLAGITRPVFPVTIDGDNLVYCSLEGTYGLLALNFNICYFQEALYLKDRAAIIEYGKLCKNNNFSYPIVGLLMKKGFYDLALPFCGNDETKMNVAMSAGELDVALECAERLNDVDLWKLLAGTAGERGNLNVMAEALEHCNDPAFATLSLAMRGFRPSCPDDVTGKNSNLFQAGFVTGNKELMFRSLKNSGLDALAYSFAMKHGFDESAAELVAENSSLTELEELPETKELPYVQQPTRSMTQWPTEKVVRWTDFTIDSGSWENGWEGDEVLDIDEENITPKNSSAAAEQSQEEDYWGEEEIDDSNVAVLSWAPISPGLDPIKTFIQDNSSKFTNFQRKVYLGDERLPPLEYASRFMIPGFTSVFAAPEAGIDIEAFQRDMEEAGQLVTKGRFPAALSLFKSLLRTYIYLDDSSVTNVDLKSYVIGLSCEIARRSMKDDLEKSLNLALVFASLKISPNHLLLALRSAMVIAFNAQCYATAATIARILKTAPSNDVVLQATKVLQKCAQTNQQDAFKCLSLNDDNTGIDVVSWDYKSEPTKTCNVCGSKSSTETKCPICEVGTIQ